MKSKLDGLYWGLGTGFVVGDELDFNIKNTINLLVGYNVNQYLAFEGEVNTSLEEKEGLETDDFVGMKLSKTTNFMINVVGKYTLATQHIPFIKFGIGYANYNVDREYGLKPKLSFLSEYGEVYKDNQELANLTYKLGVGYEFALTKNHSFVVDYNYFMTPKDTIKYTDSKGVVSTEYEGDVSYSTINLAYKYSF